MAGPTLDDVTDAKCAEEFFYKCLPYGVCYNHQSYCSDNSKTAESCFPDKIAGDNDKLLVWCQNQMSNNLTKLLHPSCKYACMDKFNASTFYQCSPCDSGNTSDDSWVILVVLALFIFLFLVSVAGNILLSVQLRKARRGRNPKEVSVEEQDDNNKKGEDGSTETPAAAVMPDTRETDRDVNQPNLNERNIPTKIHIDAVPARNTANLASQIQDINTSNQNGAPGNQNYPARISSPDAHNGLLMNQSEPDQGRHIQSVDPVNQFEPVLGRNSQADEAGYYSEPRASVASSSSVSFRRHIRGTSEERSALIPRNQATESDNSLSRGHGQDLFLTFSTSIPEAEGKHELVTNLSKLELE